MFRFFLATIVMAVMSGRISAANWPGFRGPAGDGISLEKELPLKWSATENIRWKTPLPEGGNSSPVVWGNRIFLTQAVDKGTRRLVMCFDRADGKLLWQRETRFEEKESTHADNPYCSATPVPDGTRVIASHGSAGFVYFEPNGAHRSAPEIEQVEAIP